MKQNMDQQKNIEVDNMPLMRFTKLTDKVRDHRKTQTMRKPRKRPFKVDDTLHIYVLEKLGTANILSITRKKLRDISLEDAHKDGFMTIHDCQETIMKIHKCNLDEEFDIIEYDPYWDPTGVRKILG